MVLQEKEELKGDEEGKIKTKKEKKEEKKSSKDYVLVLEFEVLKMLLFLFILWPWLHSLKQLGS